MLRDLGGFAILFLLIVPRRFALGAGAFGIGTGLTAYRLGLRHAFDADHISATDNATRRLGVENRESASVGLSLARAFERCLRSLLAVLARRAGTPAARPKPRLDACTQ